MPNNSLVTGPPRSGKTTVLERVVEALEERGLAVGGVAAPELREGADAESGQRVGFELVDLATGERAVMAHVEHDDGPAVGKYRVDVDAVDELSATALERARDADVAVVDEIAPMEVHSDAFRDGVRALLDSETPLLAAIHYRSSSGFVGEVKERDDLELFEVSEETREELPRQLVERIAGGT